MNKKEVFFGLIAAIFLALVISPFASSWPDGLEAVAQNKGFIEKGQVQPVVTAPIPDYAWPKVGNERIATSLAGVFGTLLVFGMGYGLAGLIKKT